MLIFFLRKYNKWYIEKNVVYFHCSFYFRNAEARAKVKDGFSEKTVAEVPLTFKSRAPMRNRNQVEA